MTKLDQNDTSNDTHFYEVLYKDRFDKIDNDLAVIKETLLGNGKPSLVARVQFLWGSFIYMVSGFTILIITIIGKWLWCAIK